MFLIGWFKLFRSLLYRSWLINYYNAIEQKSLFGMVCRFWGWLNCNENYQDDEEVQWAFNISEEVLLKNTKYVGMIWLRYMRFGNKIYEVKIGKRYYLFYESELEKTDLRVYSKVVIKEVQFKTLREGHFCVPTKRWIPQYPNYSYPITATYWTELQQDAARRK